MAGATLKLTVSGGGLKQLAAAADSPFQGIESGVFGDMRSGIRREFAARAWSTPGGGSQAWEPRHPFGTKQPSNPPLRNLYSAWMGGPGGGEERGPKRVALTARVPGGHVHAGGTGTARSFTRTRIPTSGSISFTQRSFVRHSFGVRLRAETIARGLSVPSRPHAGATPALAAKVEKRVAKNLGLT